MLIVVHYSVPETKLGNLTVVSPSMPPLASISSAFMSRLSDFLTSLSVAPCTSQKNNNSTEKKVANDEKEYLHSSEKASAVALNRFIEPQSSDNIKETGTE